MAPSWFGAILVVARNPRNADRDMHKPAHGDGSAVKTRQGTLAESPLAGRFAPVRGRRQV